MIDFIRYNQNRVFSLKGEKFRISNAKIKYAVDKNSL